MILWHSVVIMAYSVLSQCVREAWRDLIWCCDEALGCRSVGYPETLLLNTNYTSLILIHCTFPHTCRKPNVLSFSFIHWVQMHSGQVALGFVVDSDRRGIIIFFFLLNMSTDICISLSSSTRYPLTHPFSKTQWMNRWYFRALWK